MDKLAYCANLKNLQRPSLLKNFKFIHGDVRSPDLVRYVLASENIDTVMHFAAQTHVDNSFGNSFAFTKDNIEGTHVLLEAVTEFGNVRRFIHVSTDEVYGESSYELGESNFEHTSVLKPTNPYSASKAAAEMLVMAYGTSYNLPYIITRGNNVYGPHQFPEKAVPKFILLAIAGKKLPVHGNGSAKRSYMYVSDVASAFDVILHKGQTTNIYNIGTHEERSIMSVAQDVCELAGHVAEQMIECVDDRAFNDRRYYIDSSKLQELGWSQLVSWKEGLSRTYQWYTSHGEEYWSDLSIALMAHPQAPRRV